MLLGLTENIITKIKQVLASFPVIEEAIVYGSRAKGNYKAGSDIDITLKSAHLTHSTLNKIMLQLEDLLLPYTFDISIYNDIDSPNLIDHIKRVGISIYRK